MSDGGRNLQRVAEFIADAFSVDVVDTRLTVTTYFPGFCFDTPKTAFTSYFPLLSKKITSPP